MNPQPTPYHEQRTTNTCFHCGTTFIAHPKQKYCTLRCRDRAARVRRYNKTPTLTPITTTVPTSPYELELNNPTPDELLSTYYKIASHFYTRNVKISPLPLPTVPIPDDVEVVPHPAENYAVAFHSPQSPLQKLRSL